jgi:hypothetical protein
LWVEEGLKGVPTRVWKLAVSGQIKGEDGHMSHLTSKNLSEVVPNQALPEAGDNARGSKPPIDLSLHLSSTCRSQKGLDSPREQGLSSA